MFPMCVMQVVQSFMDSADSDTATANMLQVRYTPYVHMYVNMEKKMSFYTCREKCQWLEKATKRLSLGTYINFVPSSWGTYVQHCV